MVKCSALKVASGVPLNFAGWLTTASMGQADVGVSEYVHMALSTIPVFQRTNHLPGYYTPVMVLVGTVFLSEACSPRLIISHNLTTSIQAKEKVNTPG